MRSRRKRPPAYYPSRSRVHTKRDRRARVTLHNANKQVDRRGIAWKAAHHRAVYMQHSVLTKRARARLTVVGVVRRGSTPR